MKSLVIGAGVSGFGAAEFLRSRGHEVRVSENTRLSAERKAPFEKLGVAVCDGGHALEHLSNMEQVVLSPGLPSEHLLIREARKMQLPITSEIDLALGEYRGRVIAVTGTNGKSTTCAMFGHVLAKLGLSVEVGGNFGVPPTSMLARGRNPDWLVLELSSYQLEQSDLVRPVAAVFTSFSHDHMARHGTLEDYLKAKWRIFSHLRESSVAVLPDYIFARGLDLGLNIPGRVRRAFFDSSSSPQPFARLQDYRLQSGSMLLSSGDAIGFADAGLVEPQNQLNASFVLAALATVLSRPENELVHYFAGFKGLPHRCELIGTVKGNPVINDSKSTNVESTLVALAAQKGRTILLMGGQGKGESYRPVFSCREKIGSLITFGASGPDIARDLRADIPGQDFPTLKAALGAISGILKEYPDCGILLSPGCASFDEFVNYEERGHLFQSALARLLD